MPTPLVEQCAALKHIVFLGTGPASYMSLADMAARGIQVHIIKGYGDTAVAEHAIALMFCRLPRYRAAWTGGARRHMDAA